MSKAYPSNLTLVQYEFLSEMIPQPKPGGRMRPEQTKGFVLLKKRWVVERTYEKTHGVSPIGQQTLSYCPKHRRLLSTLP